MQSQIQNILLWQMHLSAVYLRSAEIIIYQVSCQIDIFLPMEKIHCRSYPMFVFPVFLSNLTSYSRCHGVEHREKNKYSEL